MFLTASGWSSAELITCAGWDLPVKVSQPVRDYFLDTDQSKIIAQTQI